VLASVEVGQEVNLQLSEAVVIIGRVGVSTRLFDSASRERRHEAGGHECLGGPAGRFTWA
jgi:hypothetical protein